MQYVLSSFLKIVPIWGVFPTNFVPTKCCYLPNLGANITHLGANPRAMLVPTSQGANFGGPCWPQWARGANQPPNQSVSKKGVNAGPNSREGGSDSGVGIMITIWTKITRNKHTENAWNRASHSDGPAQRLGGKNGLFGKKSCGQVIQELFQDTLGLINSLELFQIWKSTQVGQFTGWTDNEG